MIDSERRVRGGIMGEGTERHQGAVRRSHINMLQTVGILPEDRIDLQHHMILIQLLVHGRNLALAKGIIERIVNRGSTDTEARSSGAVNDQGSFEAAVLLIRVDIR